MKKVIGYIRVSTEYQKLKENSINNQIQSINKYCDNDDMCLIDIFEDNGVSGMNSDRSGLNQLFDKVKKDNIDIVIVYSLSRLGRKLKDVIQHQDIMGRIEKHPKVALTEKKMSSEVFSYGRDHGHFGRIFNSAVVPKDSLQVLQGHMTNPMHKRGYGCEVVGFAYTPQDGNSLLSSIGAAMKYLYPEDYQEKMKCFDKYLHNEI